MKSLALAYLCVASQTNRGSNVNGLCLNLFGEHSAVLVSGWISKDITRKLARKLRDTGYVIKPHVNSVRNARNVYTITVLTLFTGFVNNCEKLIVGVV